MQKTITRNELYMIEQEIMSMQKESPALALLLSKQITQFIGRTNMHSKVMHARFKKIQEKYIQKDENGNFMTVGEPESKEWKYIESKVDLEKAAVLDVSQVKDAFNKECTAFFKQSITFEW